MTTPLTSIFDMKAAPIPPVKAPVSARLSMGPDGQWLMTYSREVGQGVPQPGSHKLYASSTKEGEMMLYMIPSNSNGKAYLITPNTISGIQPLLDSYKKGTFRPTTVTVTNASSDVPSSPLDSTTNSISRSSEFGKTSVGSVIKAGDRATPAHLAPTSLIRPSTRASLAQPQSGGKIAPVRTPVLLLRNDAPMNVTPRFPPPYVVQDSVPRISRMISAAVADHDLQMRSVPNHKTKVRFTRPTKGGNEFIGAPGTHVQINNGRQNIIGVSKAASIPVKSTVTGIVSGGNTNAVSGNKLNVTLPLLQFKTGASIALLSLVSNAQTCVAQRVVPGVQSLNTTAPTLYPGSCNVQLVPSNNGIATNYGTATAVENAPQLKDGQSSVSMKFGDESVKEANITEVEENSSQPSIKIDSVFSLVGTEDETVKSSDTDTGFEDSDNENLDSDKNVNKNNNNDVKKHEKKKKRKQKKRVEAPSFTGLRQILEKVECFVVVSRLKCGEKELDLTRVLKQKDWENIVPPCSLVCRENEVKRLMANRVKRSIRIKKNLEKKLKVRSCSTSKVKRGLMTGSPTDKLKPEETKSQNSSDNPDSRVSRAPCELEIRKRPVEYFTHSFLRNILHESQQKCQKPKKYVHENVDNQINSDEIDNTNVKCPVPDTSKVIGTQEETVVINDDVPFFTNGKMDNIKPEKVKIVKLGDKSSINTDCKQKSVLKKKPQSLIVTIPPTLSTSNTTQSKPVEVIVPHNVSRVISSVNSNLSSPIGSKNAPTKHHILPDLEHQILPPNKDAKFVLVRKGEKSVLYPVVHNTVQARAYALDEDGNAATLDTKTQPVLQKNSVNHTVVGTLSPTNNQTTIVCKVPSITCRPSVTTTQTLNKATISKLPLSSTPTLLTLNPNNIYTAPVNSSQSPTKKCRTVPQIITRLPKSSTTVSPPKQIDLIYSVAGVQVKKEPLSTDSITPTTNTFNPATVKIKTEPKKGYPDEIAEEHEANRKEKTASKRTAAEDEAHELKIKRLKEMLEQQERDLEEFRKKQSERPPIDFENI